MDPEHYSTAASGPGGTPEKRTEQGINKDLFLFSVSNETVGTPFNFKFFDLPPIIDKMSLISPYPPVIA